MSNIEDDKTVIYPFCYKISDGCPPRNNCKTDKDINDKNDEVFDCIELLSKYMSVSSSNFISQEKKDEAHKKTGMCLKKYGDIYDKLGMKPYVNPKTYAVLFPNNERIQANYNLFLRDIGSKETNSPKEYNLRREKLELYQILLNEKLREVYNDFYQSHGFSNVESITPKNYGITEIIASDSSGGKNKKRKKTKITKIKKTKRARTKRRMRKNQ